MKTYYKKSGYSSRVANQYIESNNPIYSLSSELDIQYRFENNKPTNEINGFKAWFSQEGLPPFIVKFSTEVNLPPYMSRITFDNLQACEVNYNVYFKADNLKVVK
ncbi:hypothetical protein M3D50_04435 [Staphylococcus capitis]|uniref:hypothetical protein n=1 Tax=Staphylococcus capitis TaxID=29388 RepID=UPI0021A34B2F|nr:hypothetical protein [Staphylococcus capitis]MCT2013747.1 hypothetical protein [Staphylococcus capitis]